MVKTIGKTKSRKSTISEPRTEERLKNRRGRWITEALGWYGAVAVVLAYTLASFNVIDVHHTPYLILNFTGALGILTVATAKHVRQSMLINAFWALMAATALLKIILQV